MKSSTHFTASQGTCYMGTGSETPGGKDLARVLTPTASKGRARVRTQGFMTPPLLLLQSTSRDALTDEGLEFQERINRRAVEEALVPPVRGSTEVSGQAQGH